MNYHNETRLRPARRGNESSTRRKNVHNNNKIRRRIHRHLVRYSRQARIYFLRLCVVHNWIPGKHGKSMPQKRIYNPKINNSTDILLFILFLIHRFTMDVFILSINLNDVQVQSGAKVYMSRIYITSAY